MKIRFGIGGDIDCTLDLDNLKEVICNSAARVLSGNVVIVIITHDHIQVIFNQRYYVADLIEDDKHQGDHSEGR